MRTSLKTAAPRREEPPEPITFEREDWVLYRTLEGLQQRGGVAKEQLRRLVMKEVTDNAFDAVAKTRVAPKVQVVALDLDELNEGGDRFLVEDNGPGIDPDEVPLLFSINRRMISTKLQRRPTRGALGNGLRVVVGAVLASEGSLVVTTRNRRLVLEPNPRDGGTTVVEESEVDHPVGTRVEISFGPALPRDEKTLQWANEAIRMAAHGRTYDGKTSPWWYDATTFHELLTASRTLPVRGLIERFDGCSGGKAGKIVEAAGLPRTTCENVTRKEAERLLEAARENTRPVKASRLGEVGPEAFPNHAYAITRGIAPLGSSAPLAEVPFCAEAWAVDVKADARSGKPGLGARRSAKDSLTVYVNRTPAAASIEVSRDKRDLNVFGCGLAHTIAETNKDAVFRIQLSITTPYMPITSDNKAPDLAPFLDAIQDVVGKATRKARRPNVGGEKVSQKEVVLAELGAAIADASGDGQYLFSDRQLLYVLRKIVMDRLDQELKLSNWKKIITAYENGRDIPGMYREARGTVYHPHVNETIPLGTLSVASYARPIWTYSTIINIEKEGWAEALKAARWPERHDCAVMSSKGFTTRAARDLVDKMAEHDEPVTVFCAHDADASGTLIYQTFQEATKARGARKIQIVNLGLEPWEGIAMGLQVERVSRGKKREPVADYVLARTDRAPDGSRWEDWLQAHRIELNAMTTPVFLAWLDRKMAQHGVLKLIPPTEVMAQELDERVEDKVRAAITERVLREANLDDQVAAAVAAIEPKKPGGAELAKGVERLFKRDQDRQWRDHVDAVASKLTKRRF